MTRSFLLSLIIWLVCPHWSARQWCVWGPEEPFTLSSRFEPAAGGRSGNSRDQQWRWRVHWHLRTHCLPIHQQFAQILPENDYWLLPFSMLRLLNKIEGTGCSLSYLPLRPQPWPYLGSDWMIFHRSIWSFQPLQKRQWEINSAI